MDPLLEHILARPDDDEARRVYADALLERGDERGVFITLQLARGARTLTDEEHRRELEVLALSGAQWLGALNPLLLAPVFARGFLTECTLTSVPPSAVGDPTWATVERLRYSGLDDPRLAELVLHPVMRALDLLSGPRGAALDALAARDGPGPRVLEVLHPLGAAAARRLGSWRPSRLTAVRLLGAAPEWADLLALLETPLARRRLTVRRLGLELEADRARLAVRCLSATAAESLPHLLHLWPRELEAITIDRGPLPADALRTLQHHAGSLEVR
jgi:uncharacterized protein (TIGR02996 family)